MLRRIATRYWALAAAGFAGVAVFWLTLASHFRGHDDASFYWWNHGEGVSLTTIGKWGSPVVDGMSGEFPTLYQFASDWIINLVAVVAGLPPFMAQVFYGVFLASALILVNFLFIRRLIGSEGAALSAAVIIALMSDLILIDGLYSFAGAPDDPGWVDKVLHVPATSIVLGTSQSLAYFVFLPALVSAYLSLVECRLGWAVVTGLLFGLVLQTSFLTFIGLASAAGAGIAVAVLTQDWMEGRTKLVALKLAALAVGLAGIVWWADGAVTLLHFVLIWVLLFCVALTNLRALMALAIVGAFALLVATPLLMHFWALRDALANLDKPVPSPVSLLVILLFFLPGFIATALILKHPVARERARELSFLLGSLVGLLAVSKGEYWGFQNHQYRFVILLVFPISVILGIALWAKWQGATRIVVLALAGLIALSLARNVAVIAGIGNEAVSRLGLFYYYGDLEVANASETRFLNALRKASLEAAPCSRVLTAPEYDYPAGLRDAALMLGVSSRPGFIPDYRYIVDRNHYRDRLAVFCFLFPDYPQFDQHTNNRTCAAFDGRTLDDGGGAYAHVSDASYKASILNLYGVELIADRESPLGEMLRTNARSYGLTTLYDDGGAILMRRVAPVNGARISRGKWVGETWTIPIRIDAPGEYDIVAAGKDAGARFAQISLSNAPDQSWEKRKGIIHGKARLEAGDSVLTLVAAPGWIHADGPEPTPFHFFAVMPSESAKQAITMSSAP